MPAGRQRETKSLQERPERRGVARKLAAEFDALIADIGSVAETGLQRDIGAEVLENVVRPGKGTDAEPHPAGKASNGWPRHR